MYGKDIFVVESGCFVTCYKNLILSSQKKVIG